MKIKVNNDLRDLLRFKIGEQYEKYEFDLEPIDRLKVEKHVYDRYKYCGNDLKTLFGEEIDRDIHLLFNADVLCAVFYRFSNQLFFKLVSAIEGHLPTNHIMIRKGVVFNDSILIAKHSLSENEIIHIKSDVKANITGLGFLNNQFYDNLNLDKFYPQSNFLENRILKKIEKFYNQKTNFDDFIKFYWEYKSLWNQNDEFNQKFICILDKLEFLIEIQDNHKLSCTALMDYNNLDKDNEKEIIDWLIKYEDEEFSMSYYGIFENIETLENHCFIIRAIEGKITIDYKKYKESLIFIKTYWNFFWELHEKYKPNSSHYNKYQIQVKLSHYLQVHKLYPDIIKKYNKSELELKKERY